MYTARLQKRLGEVQRDGMWGGKSKTKKSTKLAGLLQLVEAEQAGKVHGLTHKDDNLHRRHSVLKKGGRDAQGSMGTDGKKPPLTFLPMAGRVDPGGRISSMFR